VNETQMQALHTVPDGAARALVPAGRRRAPLHDIKNNFDLTGLFRLDGIKCRVSGSPEMHH
jgi:hypothetical protein